MPSGGGFTNCNCGPDTAACENPTQPIAAVGLCLADGTPVAVTVVRDCAGTVTSEGWIDLTTGTWSAGPPPAGTVACGDSRSITTTGTFCDVAEDGTVLGLVLVEYQYAADGSIDAVRLVDAVTGETYTPQGDVTTCPAGVEQPERDLIELCDVTTDESGVITSAPFVRDYMRDENGAIVGHSDYTLDGQPYEATGEVGQCTPTGDTPGQECQRCETLVLCDFVPDEPPGDPEIVYEAIPLAELPPAGSYGDGSPVTGALPNGVEYSVNVGEWLGPQGHYTYYPYDGTQTWTFDQPVYLRFGLRGLNISPTECYILPEGAVVESISPAHTWDPDTRRLCGPSGSSAVDESVFLLGPVTELPIFPSGSSTGGRGPGLIEVGLPVEDDTPPAGTSVPFLRTVCRDCSGTVTEVTDTALDGETPYTPVGDVTTCGAAAGTGGGGTSPTIRVDVETDVLCIRDEAGDITGQVVAERVYNDQSGDLIAQRLTDPTTGDPVELPAGSELVVCNEPECPVAFATECVGVVERTEASYDNTSLIGGVPGQCGGVQGPGGQFPCQPTTGGLTIVSWIVNGEEVIGDGGREFAGGPCGQGTDANRGMHRNWASALTNLDPSGATWTAQTEPACLWFVGSTGGTQTTYGPMVVEDADGQQWTLSPAQSCEETQFTKVYTQDCDGAVSVSWLDADGVATDPPAGDQVPCGTGCSAGGGRGLDVEPLLLCDVAADGASTTFLRHLIYGSAGQVTGALDTALDGFAPYTPTGVVGVCDRPEPVTVLEECRCDDTDGDGAGDTPYVELIAVEEDGALRPIGTYAEDLSGPYTPVSPVPCEQGEEGADPAIGVQAHRVEVAPGGSWSAPAGVVQSVTATAHSGTGTVTTQDGASTLFEGESVTWSVVRSGDAALVGPLVIAADTGTVTVAYTVTVTM